MSDYTPKFKQALAAIEVAAKEGMVADAQRIFQEKMLEVGPYERINNLYRIRPKNPVVGEASRTQFFRMNRPQDLFWAAHSNRDEILKSRQVGFTTLSCLIALDKALFTQGVHTAIMAHVQNNVKKYFNISKLAFDWFLKDWGAFYPITRQVDNVSQLKFKELGSDLLVCTEAKGLTLDFLHVSEAAFVEDDRISESIEAVPPSAWVILESTPDTASGLFFDLWTLGKEGSGAFKPHFFPWFLQYPEEHDEALYRPPAGIKYTEEESELMRQHGLNGSHIMWRRSKIAECGGDLGEFLRKHPEDDMTCFMSGSSCVFPQSTQASLWRLAKVPSFTGDLVIS